MTDRFSAILLQALPEVGPGEGTLALVILVVLLLILVLNTWATISVVRGRLALLAKVLWLAAIWFASPLGALLYALLGRTR